MTIWIAWLTLLSLAFIGLSAAVNASSSPVSVPVSTYWDGNDGAWSTFFVEIGTPGQAVRLLPSTSSSAGSAQWVVIDQGCSVANPSLPDCADLRGGDPLFASNASTSWSTQGLSSDAIYSLNTFEEGKLGLSGNAIYGFDTVSLGLNDPTLPLVTDQVIAGVGTSDFWLGSLGLSPYPFNFSDLAEPQTSLLSTLYNQSYIPGLAWAYTAGANYKDPPVLGSLTLGGYDTTRFEPNNVSFAFGSDFSRDLLVKLQSITYDTLGSKPLLANPVIDIFIDSLVSQLWLPISVCEEFERAFNLTWNETAELYLFDESTHQDLLAQNPSFTFTIANGSDSSSSTVEIIFPYAAFDLNVTQPLVESEQRYFPLKRAQDDTQYTLGRVFLQEAYVVADYERGNFSVSQALFPDTGVAQNLVAIRPKTFERQPTESSGGSSGLSGGAIGGIVVAAVVVVAAAACFFLWRRRRQRRRQALIEVMAKPQSPHEKDKLSCQQVPELEENEAAVRELDGLYGAKTELEADAKQIHELGDITKTHELASSTGTQELESPNRPHELASTSWSHELESPMTPLVELEAPVPRDSTHQ